MQIKYELDNCTIQANKRARNQAREMLRKQNTLLRNKNNNFFRVFKLAKKMHLASFPEILAESIHTGLGSSHD